MDIGAVLSVAQTLFASLQCAELKDICSMLGYESELEDLQRIVSTVKAVLLVAETKEVVNPEAKLWIEELKDAVYDADDLLDKFITMIHQKKLIKQGGKASEKVRSFFSRYNPLGIAYSMSQGVKKIRKKLDAAAKTHAQFGFTIDPQPIRLRREETCSYVKEANIIGREPDVEKIVGLLLNGSRKDVSFLAIVGIGGLGKTALAQLVYNDARIRNAFSPMIWTCISDYNQEKIDVLRKIVDSKDERSTKESLQSKVHEILAGKKYLLVLDDVWTENRNQWLNFEEFLPGGQQGSWVLLTTRSHTTASIVGDGTIIHKLDGLSKEKSWYLFKKIAFDSEHSNPSKELVEIGQRIVKGCAGVPLAIRVAGSLLYQQDKSKWVSFEKIGLSNFQESQIDIMPILKLSYHQLESQVKNCFTYCTLFPKDYEIHVFLLKWLWRAQGYIVPLDDCRSMEAIADDYFSILLRRCFFQDVQYDFRGEIDSCKIHDLMHDIAEEVAGRDICAQKFAISNDAKEARHIAYTFDELPKLSFSKTRLRSCLYVGPRIIDEDSMINLSTSTVKALLTHCVCLRVLDLRNSGTLPQLKLLVLFQLDELEYIDEEKGEVGGSIRVLTPDGRLMIAHGLLSFPCLEELLLVDLGKLKGWGNSRLDIGDNSSSMTPMLLPQLKFLSTQCNDFKCSLLLPKLEKLDMHSLNESLEINRVSSSTTATPSSASSFCYYGVPKLKRVIIWNVAWLNKMPAESFQCLEKLFICFDKEMESLGEVGEVLRSCSSSLVSLRIGACPKLRRVISGGLEYLSALQTLKIETCDVLSLSEEERQDYYGMIGIGFPCPRFLHSLRSLSLKHLPKLVNLPNWMHYLSALEALDIIPCSGLETMPDWIANVPSISII